MKASSFLLFVLGFAWPALGAENLHPAFVLRDAGGAPVTGEAIERVSDIETCGQCHDTGFIAAHSTHGAAGVTVSCFQCHLEGGLEGVSGADFDAQGRLDRQMTPPDCTVCGRCHGVVHKDKAFFEYRPGVLRGEEPGPYWRTLATGEIFSPQLLSFSHVNLEGKSGLAYPWDVHAARGVHCISCHYPSNDPARAGLLEKPGPSHLVRDPRTLDLAAYLRRPDHRFATASCESCHDVEEAHKGFPYPKRHTDSLACQACHVPTLRGLALEYLDRTVTTSDLGPRMGFREVEPGPGRQNPNTWYEKGYRPALLHESLDGRDTFSPFNLVTVWEWVSGEAGTAVPLETVARAWTNEDGTYHADIVARCDANHDGRLSKDELVLDSEEKVGVIRSRLEALGVAAPRIAGRVTAYPIRHGVVEGKWVENDCQSCHDDRSRFNEVLPLASGPFPGGVIPVPDEKTARLMAGRTVEQADGGLVLAGNAEPVGHYVLGHSRRPWSDTIGFWVFVLAILGVAAHGTVRAVKARGSREEEVEHERAYMYGVYERIWHWTMASSIVMLLLTGFQVHYPDRFAPMGYPTAVFVHNFFAVVLLVNAFLGMFYHLATGEIRQFVPEGAGLARRLWIQAQYYLTGIFVGASHPFVKTRQSKLNPLQQFTYAGLLNVLFPFQVVTGLLLWVAGLMPDNAVAFGGLSLVAPLHNLGSWLFLTFLVTHVYLTTTGHTITSNIEAMLTGWDIVEPGAARTSQGERS